MDKNQNQPGNSILKELYEEWIREDLDYIKSLNSENKIFQALRESHQDEWEIVELCREVLFDNAKQISFLREQIEYERGEIKKFSRV